VAGCGDELEGPVPEQQAKRRLGHRHELLQRVRRPPGVDQLGIVLGSPEHAVTTLSGGNQQKVIIARWLAFGPWARITQARSYTFFDMIPV
jgi:ABC-type sugar transport system ATPase subunit